MMLRVGRDVGRVRNKSATMLAIAGAGRMKLVVLTIGGGPLGSVVSAAGIRGRNRRRHYYSLTLKACGTHRLVGLWSRLKLKAGRAHYRDRSTGSDHLKVRRAYYRDSNRYTVSKDTYR